MSDNLEPASSDGGFDEGAQEGFSLILLPVDILERLHTDFSTIVGHHLADHVFYQTGYRCGEVSSAQYREFSFEGEERIKLLREMINQSGFGMAEVTEMEGDGGELDIHITDAAETPAIGPPGLVFAAGFIAGFATTMSKSRFRCIWDTPDAEDGSSGYMLHLARVPGPSGPTTVSLGGLMGGGRG